MQLTTVGMEVCEVSMHIFSRASKEPRPGSEGSLVTKNVLCSFKILACVTVAFVCLSFSFSSVHFICLDYINGLELCFVGGKKKKKDV